MRLFLRDSYEMFATSGFFGTNFRAITIVIKKVSVLSLSDSFVSDWTFMWNNCSIKLSLCLHHYIKAQNCFRGKIRQLSIYRPWNSIDLQITKSKPCYLLSPITSIFFDCSKILQRFLKLPSNSLKLMENHKTNKVTQVNCWLQLKIQLECLQPLYMNKKFVFVFESIIFW